jgi:hypothetical protein
MKLTAPLLGVLLFVVRPRRTGVSVAALTVEDHAHAGVLRFGLGHLADAAHREAEGARVALVAHDVGGALGDAADVVGQFAVELLAGDHRDRQWDVLHFLDAVAAAHHHLVQRGLGGRSGGCRGRGHGLLRVDEGGAADQVHAGHHRGDGREAEGRGMGAVQGVARGESGQRRGRTVHGVPVMVPWRAARPGLQAPCHVIRERQRCWGASNLVDGVLQGAPAAGNQTGACARRLCCCNSGGVCWTACAALAASCEAGRARRRSAARPDRPQGLHLDRVARARNTAPALKAAMRAFSASRCCLPNRIDRMPAESVRTVRHRAAAAYATPKSCVRAVCPAAMVVARRHAPRRHRPPCPQTRS